MKIHLILSDPGIIKMFDPNPVKLKQNTSTINIFDKT
jgi:hypothetical protein